MRNKNLVMLAGMTLLVLSGCGSDSSPSPASNPSSANKIFSADPDGNPESITDAATLADELDSIFGGENAEPVTINPGDTIGDVFDRAKNS